MTAYTETRPDGAVVHVRETEEALPISVGDPVARAMDVAGVRKRLEARGGGYEIIHTSPTLELGVYVLVAPEPDRQTAHADDELYVVLEGRGELTVEGAKFPLASGQAAYVPAHAAHQFTGYEGLSVLVVLARGSESAPLEKRLRRPYPV